MGDLTEHFSLSEFACPCGKCTPIMDMTAVTLFQRIRSFYGPISPTRGGGYRCQAYNAKIGGTPQSYHMLGMAMDIACSNPVQRHRLLEIIFMLKTPGVEVCDRHIHVDTRKGDPVCIWGVSK